MWFLNYLQPAVQAAFEHLYEDADLRQAQIDAWLHVVEHVQDHPALFGYDLMNEPFGKIRRGRICSPRPSGSSASSSPPCTNG